MSEQAKTASDIRADTWLDRRAPAAVRPYLRLMRVDRPIGTWLLLFPCWWSLGFAWLGGQHAHYALLFAVGALIMRGAGCTWNDITDRDYDVKVARTADRPIPSGAVSVRQAVVFLAVLLALALAILLTFNRFTVMLGAASLVLVFSYPFMKRITYWPQLFLGLTFNWGALIGWAAVDGSLALPCLLLYAGGIAWTLGYDTIYAHQDKEDDALIGVKSSALALGERSRPAVTAFYLAAVGCFALAGYFNGFTWPFWLGLLAGAAQLAWQARTVDFDDPADCLAKFHSNRWFGWIFLAGIVGDQVLLFRTFA